MKKFKNKKHLISIIIFALLLIVIPLNVAAKTVLDEIQNYEIEVNMRNDGTMDIRYHFDWKVLDDSSEGPLSWVQIGIPNKNVDEIKALTDNINEITFSSGNETHVKIYFDREYYADEIVSFEFSIHQSNMYVIDEEEHLLRYSFTPGWFDEIQVNQITVKWNKANVLKTNAEAELNGDYYVWNGSLDYGEKLNTSVYYNLDAFNVTEDGQMQENNADSWGSGMKVLLAIIIIVLVIVVIIALLSDDDYGSHSGFGGSGYRHSTYIHHSSCVSRCACVSHCACACACAGGGRAGCSKKDFFSTDLKSDTVLKVLKEE